jgi:hypothetical protein
MDELKANLKKEFEIMNEDDVHDILGIQVI